MQFTIRDKTKIKQLRKFLQLLTQFNEGFSIRVTDTGIRFLVLEEDGTERFADLGATWFNLYKAEGLEGAIQVSCQRDVFLQSLPDVDCSELELNVVLESDRIGYIQMLSTQSMFNCEAHVPFSVDDEVCDQEYDFNGAPLLLSSNHTQVNLKAVFRNRIK